ncbi:general secretion pathway protein G [Thermotomaculum hydrothermale]|uniref:General secretion pathway protein G n=1 Tax=Thermotomaculum hydrothermale TaxID=981385 RepID=A0A7R6PDQ7_9BACT|nr:prepilin-type N-terminal cleavage/methylation domain-containing protein [Thermotomaculum hydrothermale]BBB31863.1 general secretion pathway protein G [Thermotomaculum hydrothermale]
MEFKGKKGFTVIELMVVMTIILLLASVAVKINKKAIIKAKEAVLKENLFQMRQAIEQYYADKGHYPDSLETLVDDGYMREIPKDPFTKSSDTWQVEYENPEDVGEDYEPGIIDVKSGYSGKALDGTNYDEW